MCIVLDFWHLQSHHVTLHLDFGVFGIVDRHFTPDGERGADKDTREARSGLAHLLPITLLQVDHHRTQVRYLVMTLLGGKVWWEEQGVFFLHYISLLRVDGG